MGIIIKAVSMLKGMDRKVAVRKIVLDWVRTLKENSFLLFDSWCVQLNMGLYILCKLRGTI